MMKKMLSNLGERGQQYETSFEIPREITPDFPERGRVHRAGCRLDMHCGSDIDALIVYFKGIFAKMQLFSAGSQAVLAIATIYARQTQHRRHISLILPDSFTCHIISGHPRPTPGAVLSPNRFLVRLAPSR